MTASKNKGGRPKGSGWNPTPDQRRLVEHYVSIGYTQEQIGSLFDVSVDTLDRHCRRELDTGSLKANAQVTGKLFSKAMSGDTTAMIFWCKTRCGWSEKQIHEHFGDINLNHREAAKEEIQDLFGPTPIEVIPNG